MVLEGWHSLGRFVKFLSDSFAHAQDLRVYIEAAGWSPTVKLSLTETEARVTMTSVLDARWVDENKEPDSDVESKESA